MSRTPLLAAAVALVAALVAPTTSTAIPGSRDGAPSAAAASSLTVSPSVYVAGQAVVFRGSLGVAGRRKVHLQTHMGRPGDTWLDLARSDARTQRDGSFLIRRPAPGMFDIRYRAVSDGRASPSVNMVPRVQEVLLQTEIGRPDLSPGEVLAGAPFTIRVDTTPDLPGVLQSPPPIPGRTLTLEQRVPGPAWQPVATTTTDSQGQASFALTAGQPGDVVYRVRLEDWSAGGNEIGWHPSFPTYVHVLGAGRRSPAAVRAPSPPPPASLPATGGASPTAAGTYSWGDASYGFEWELGQSLTSPPSRGTRVTGRWQDASDGTGRAFVRNGAMALSSEVYNRVDGTRGSTWATLENASSRYGRWEARLWVQSLQDVAPDFEMVVELVPADPAQYHCGAQNITVAEVTAHGSSVQVGAGALAPAARWTRVVNAGPTNQIFYNYAVEVTKDHITWFLNGKAIASTREPSLLSGVALTPRITMRGSGVEQQNSTQILVDWVRAYDLGSGREVVSKKALTQGPAVPDC